jgi:hypothetical protein
MEAQELEQYALGELPSEISERIELHLQTCVDCGVQFEQSRAAMGQWAYSGPENRKSPRVETDDPAVLTVLDPDRTQRFDMRIVNASKEGLKLEVPKLLLPGAIVQVHVRDLFIQAEVRYCIAARDKFHAGVRIHDVFPSCG